MPYADVGGKEIWYEESGSGPALVLVHEGVADSSMWDELVDQLACAHRVIRYDLPGYGRSSLPPGPYSDVRDLASLLGGLGVDSASLVGVSVGGRIALEYALVHPDRVDALVLVATGLPDWQWSEEMGRIDQQEEELIEAGDIDGAAELAVQVWFDGPRRSPHQVDSSLRERALEMNRRAYTIQVPAYAAAQPPGPREQLDPPASARLDDVRAPTLVVVPSSTSRTSSASASSSRPAFRVRARWLCPASPTSHRWSARRSSRGSSSTSSRRRSADRSYEATSAR